jgi:predicted nucleotidyltransferase
LGSAARGVDFDPELSDVDFLVQFDHGERDEPLEQFFGLSESLQSLLGRPVDLVELDAVTNPFILAGIDRSRELVYAA